MVDFQIEDLTKRLKDVRILVRVGALSGDSEDVDALDPNRQTGFLGRVFGKGKRARVEATAKLDEMEDQLRKSLAAVSAGSPSPRRAG